MNTKERRRHLLVEIQVLACDRHKNVSPLRHIIKQQIPIVKSLVWRGTMKSLVWRGIRMFCYNVSKPRNKKLKKISLSLNSRKSISTETSETCIACTISYIFYWWFIFWCYVSWRFYRHWSLTRWMSRIKLKNTHTIKHVYMYSQSCYIKLDTIKHVYYSQSCYIKLDTIKHVYM